MRIAYLIQNIEYGGAEIQLLGVAKTQTLSGHQVLIITLRTPSAHFVKLMQELEISCVSLELYNIFQLPGVILSIRNHILKFGPDVAHSHMFHSNILLRCIAPTIKPIKVVCTAHNIKEGGKIRDRLYHYTDSLCDVTTNVSQAAVDRYNADGLVKNNKCVLIENGIDTAKFHHNSSARTEFRDYFNVNGCYVWLAIGSLTQQKDYIGMLMALKIIVQEHPNTRLFIVGDGPERPRIESKIKELNLDEQVSLLGLRDDVDKLYSFADGYVMSSAWEGLPLVLLEALSCELPCVATEVGGNERLILGSKGGFLCKPNSAISLANKMKTLMALEPSLVKAMGKQGRDYIMSNYGLESVATTWRALYQELVTQ